MVRYFSFLFMMLLVLATSACAIDDQLAGEKDDTAAEPDLTVSQLGSADSANNPYQGDLAWCDLAIDDLDAQLPYHFWTFRGECSDVFIDVANRDGKDPYLLLYANYGYGWEIIDWNDDCSADTWNACLEIGTEPNVDYLVAATSWEYMVLGQRPDMNYHLRVSCRDDAGECFDPTAETEVLCGSRGLEPCPEGQYCDWTVDEPANACGATDIPGVCRPLPDSCPRVNQPACGCDGTTYTNECYAAMMGGVDIAHDGYCHGPRNEGEPCGGIAGFLCADGLVCDFSAHETCGADYMGVCVVHEDVFCTMVWAPVCGCDGHTYGNDCQRRAAHVAFDHFGQCEL